MKQSHLQLRLEADLYEWLRERAKANSRSISGEVRAMVIKAREDDGVEG